MINPITVQELAKTHKRDQKELWKQAEARRIAHQAQATQPGRPSPVARIVDGVGSLLTEIGRWSTGRKPSASRSV